MKQEAYRGYTLHLSEKVDIYAGDERVDQADDIATAKERIDAWMEAR